MWPSAVDGLPLLAGAVLAAVTGWAWAYGLIGLCTRILRRESAVVRCGADASYWMYLVHLPVLAVIQVYMADLGWSIVAKLGLAWIGTAAVLLLSYDLIVRGTRLGKWLNGHRQRPLLSRPRTVTADGTTLPPLRRCRP